MMCCCVVLSLLRTTGVTVDPMCWMLLVLHVSGHVLGRQSMLCVPYVGHPVHSVASVAAVRDVC
jgi:hypothetical protein